MTDAEIAQRLTHIHQTLELIAFLLAVLLLGSGSIGVIAGSTAILLLVANVVARSLD